ncbi:MAG: hypothetical protein NVSMB46_09950 [Candidatus Saccharimonadales bacterium]
MTSELLIHPGTFLALKQSAKSKAQAYIITGRFGDGKPTLAYLLIALKLKVSFEEAKNITHLLHIAPQDNLISIENIRNIQNFFKLKTIGKNEYKRVLIIEDAHCMSIEAQNAFLKLMEEPPNDTLIVLTLIPSIKILETIYSRAQKIQIKKLSLRSTLEFFNKKAHSDKEITANYLISDGCVGLLVALLNKEKSNPMFQSIENAKKIYGYSRARRLAQINLYKEREATTELILAMKRIAIAALTSAVLNKALPQIKRWVHITEKCQKAEESLRNNPNIKLLLTDLFLSL